MSSFLAIPMQPPNSILGVALECSLDPCPEKINLTIGAYRDENGKPSVLEVVRKAELLLISKSLDHEYLPQDGHGEFLRCSQTLMFGTESLALAEGRVHSIQGISGTGSLRLATEFISHLMPGRVCYYPAVTWPAHPTICEESGLEIKTYRYVDETGISLDFDSLIEDLNQAPPKSIILMHNCAHNPTGVDPTNEQWQRIADVMKERDLFPLFDNAYQGFVSGCPNTDAYAVRLFEKLGFEMIVACSFAKNFGLYGERVGALHFVVSDKETIPAVASQLRVISRSLYSTCPSYGARIVATILSDPTLTMEWEMQCREMAERLSGVRSSLHAALTQKKVKGEWSHIVKQRGMFSYTGIEAPVVARLKSDFHIYMLSNGRISLAGLNNGNIDRFATALAEIMGQNEA